MHPLAGFLITGLLPLVAVLATMAWFVRYAQRHNSEANPLRLRDVPPVFWVVAIAEFVLLVALIIWGYPQPA